ncbi:MAG: hypothetical protein IJO29_04615 [Oscillospiraceae bacterium]|nr:hypothetical protein [Oscillospiraceae bacterium]
MIRIKFDSAKSKDEIFKAFMPYNEIEKHEPFSLIDEFMGEYLSSHTGIHSYLNYEKGVIKGYYETGELISRKGDKYLTTFKSWFAIKVVEKDGKTKIRGWTFFAPGLSVLFLIELAVIIRKSLTNPIDIIGWGFIAIILCWIFVPAIKEQNYMYDVISKVCE